MMKRTLAGIVVSLAVVSVLAAQIVRPRPATRPAVSRWTATQPATRAAAPEAEPQTRPAGLSSEESLVPLEQLLRKRPLHKTAFTNLVSHYTEQGRLQDLVKEQEQRLAAMPGDTALQILLARLYLRAGQPEKAAALLDKIETLPPALARDQSEFLVLKSDAYQRVNRREDARKMLTEALSRAQTVVERIKLSEAAADLDLQAGDKATAVSRLTELSKQFADNYFYRKQVADALAQRELHEAAVGQYRELLSLVKNQADKRCEVLRQLGSSLERLDKRQEAIDTYVEAIGLLAGGHWMQRELHERVVNLYRASGRLDDLVKYCREQVARAPEQTSMRTLLADVLAAAGKVDEAKATSAEAVQLFPKDRALSEHRVGLLDRLGDKAGVAAEYERIVAQYPDDVELYIAYGQHLAQNKQLEAARNQWRRVLESKVTDAGMAARLGGLFEVYELFDDAVNCYERAITLGPKQTEGYSALARLWFYRGEKEKAVAALKRLAAAAPDDPAVAASLAETYVGLQMRDEALEAITRACELAPNEVRHRIARADLLVQVGKLEEALKVRRAAIDLTKNPQQQAQAIDVLVSMHASADKLKALEAAEEQNVQKDANNTVSLLLLARSADVKHDLKAERRWLDQLLKAEPAHEEGRRSLARLHEAAGDIDAAVAEYRRIIEQNPARGRVYYQAIADLKLRYNDKAGAIDVFEQMIKASPGNATVLNSAAEQLVRMGEQEKAIAYYQQSLNLQGNRHEVRLAYAKALQEAGRLEEAMGAFKQVSLQRNDRDSAVDALGKLHEVAGQLGSLDELIQELEARVEANPEDTLVAGTLAELLVREYEYARAMELLDLVLRHNPRDVELQLVRAEVLRRLTRFEDALEGYRKVLRSQGIDKDFVLGEMGKTWFEAGQIDQAKSTWRQVQHKLYAGSLLQNNGLLGEAIEVYREGIRLKPDDFALHRNLIVALQAAGKTDEAMEAARRLLDLEPDNTFNIQQLAKAYLQRGNREAAAETAGRLFGASVGEKKNTGPIQPQQGMVGMPGWMQSLSQLYGGMSGQARSNLDKAVEFFKENGLVAELEEVLTAQLTLQPDNAMLRLKAVELFGDDFSKPEMALTLLKELEAMPFPIEYQQWLGQSSQRDFFRVQQYQLIGSKPAIRDARLTELSRKPESELDRDERLELACIRQAQGNTDAAIKLLESAVKTDEQDVVALSVLADSLVRAERFEAAEPHVQRLVAILGEQREKLQTDMVERIRRDFVRNLPLHLQMRVTDQLLRDIAYKWTLGQSFATDFTGFAGTMGWHRARLTLATIYAKTKRMDEARKIWDELSPPNAADSEGWTTLAAVTQLHDQQDLAYKYYEKALQASKVLAADPLLRIVYGGSSVNAWLGESSGIDASFNKIVAAFADQNKLIELYDFLRETDQAPQARRIAEQYKLYDQLKTLYRERFEAARKTFQESHENQLARSVPYFVQACKLAELYDQTGEWPKASEIYEEYLKDFTDELGLLTTLREVAEAQSEFERAIQLEKRVIETKTRLARQAIEWGMRDVSMTPSIPQPLGDQQDRYEWMQRWGRASWWGGSQDKPLEVAPSWMHVAQLYLSMENPLAAADAMERAISAATTDRQEVAGQVLTLIQQRQLAGKMLPVLRMLAVYLPTDERAQLAFAESLEANSRKELAAEVYRRMIRRGVSDVNTLARIRKQLEAVQPKQAEAQTETLETLEAQVAADPTNAANQLRLAKAYYYSLRIDDALKALIALEKTAPHLEGLHDLLVEIYTLRNEPEKLIEALRTSIERASDPDEKRKLQYRLAEELLALGKTDEVIGLLKKLPDAKDPWSYLNVGMLLEYFGRHADAAEQFKLAGRSQSGGGRFGGGDDSGAILAKSMVLQGDIKGAAGQILKAIDEQIRQQSQYGGMAGMMGMFDDSRSNYFTAYMPLFVLHPELADELVQRLQTRRKDKPQDVQAATLIMQLYRQLGRTRDAEAIVTEMADKGSTDQQLMMQIIDRAIREKQYEKAIKMAEDWIAQQPKPTLPPGIPPQYAGLMNLMAPRNVMQCKIGDIYWKMDNKDKAFECYRKLIDDKVDETKLAFASICMMRGRLDEARKLVDTALEQQRVKSPQLLMFRSLLGALENQPEKAFDDLAAAAEAGPVTSMFGEGDEDSALGLVTSFAQNTGQIDRFVAFMDKQIAKNPNKWSRYTALANVLRNAGRVADADALLERAAKVKSLQREVLQQRIDWKEGSAPADELIPLYRQLIEESEKKVKPRGSFLGGLMGGGSSREEQIDTQPLRDRLGDLLWDKDDRDGARKVWTERMNMKESANILQMANRYLEKRAYDMAEEAYKQVLESAPNQTGAHQALAKLACQRQAHDEAAAHLREVFLAAYRSMLQTGGSQRYDSSGEAVGGDVRIWAAETASDPKTAERLAKSATPEDAEAHLTITCLTGDWAALEVDLRKRLETTPHDPMVWTLWGHLCERKGDWVEAAKAWEQVRRLDRTTISQRREQLKLVLAGRHVKDAAAGVRDASAVPSGPAPAVGSSGASSRRYMSSYYGRYYGGGASTETTRLAGLYVKLKQFDKAERILLFGAEREQVRSVLPTLSYLMQAQNANDRALQLLTLSVVLSGDASETQSLAHLMAKAGQVDAAVDLLTRAYQFGTREERGGGITSMLYGWYGGGRQVQDTFEDSQEQQVATALYWLLQKYGKIDVALEKLAARVREQPEDARTGRLLLSLQVRSRRWDDALKTAQAIQAANPADKALAAELMHIHMQRGDWDAALAAMETLRKGAPEQADRLRMAEAFLRLMKNDATGAVQAIAPLLDQPLNEEQGGNRAAIMTVLMAARDYDRLVGFLNARLARNELDEAGQTLLVAVLRMQGKFKEAAAVSLQRLWKEPVADSSSQWYTSLARTIAAARQSGAEVKPEKATPEDLALIACITEGSAAGLEAFRKLAGEQPENFNARRGLVFTARLAGDATLAAQTNGALLEWLAPRRPLIWQPPVRPPLGESAGAMLKRFQGEDVDATSALGLSMSFMQLMQQLIGNDSSPSQDGSVKYESAWQACGRLQRDLFLEAGRKDDYLALVQAQTRQRPRSDDQQRYYQRYRYSRFGSGYSYSWSSNDYSSQGQETPDWRTAMKEDWSRYRVLAPLAEYYDKEASRLAEEDWPAAAEVYASLGRADDARKLHQRGIEAWFINLQSAQPAPAGADANEYRWRWGGWEYMESNQLWSLRSALRSGMRKRDDKELQKREYPFTGRPDEPWQLALLDPAIEARLLKLAECLQPGWDQTQLAGQIISLYDARRQPQKVIELIERMAPAEDLMRSQKLDTYLAACTETKDYARIGKAIDEAAKQGASFKNSVDMARLVLLRLESKAADADKLEADLIARCRTEPTSPLLPDTRLLQELDTSDQTSIRYFSSDNSSAYRYSGYSRYQYYRSWNRSAAAVGSLTTARELASSLGIRFGSEDDQDSLGLTDIQTAYSTAGLFADAVRILDRDLARESPKRSPRERIELIEQKAGWLDSAGDKAAAQAAWAEAEKFWQQEAKDTPSDAVPCGKLKELYASDLNRNNEKARQALLEAKRRNPQYDQTGMEEAHLLYELSLYAEAWKLYNSAIQRGWMTQFHDVAALFEAGLAAQRAGQVDAARSLLNQALWRDPGHKLAKEARAAVKLEGQVSSNG